MGTEKPNNEKTKHYPVDKQRADLSGLIDHPFGDG